MLESIVTLLCMFQCKWPTCEIRETGERDGTQDNNSPQTKKLRLRLGWGRGGVWVEVRLGWGSANANLMNSFK